MKNKAKTKPRSKHFGRGWLSVRLDRIQEDPIPLSVVRDKLAIHERTLRYWLADQRFIDAGIAEIIGMRWYFSKAALYDWFVATGAIVPARQIAKNPPDDRTRSQRAAGMKTEALERLGLPLDFMIKNHP